MLYQLPGEVCAEVGYDTSVRRRTGVRACTQLASLAGEAVLPLPQGPALR